MRKIREREVRQVKQLVEQNDADGSGTLSGDEVDAFIESLGYFPDRNAVKEAAIAAGLDPEDSDLDLSELFQLLLSFRQREGLSNDFMDEIERAFKKYDRLDEDEISTVDIGKILRWLGFPTPFEVQQHLIAQVDLDDSGRLSLSELRKLMRLYRDKELEQMRTVFASQDNKGHHGALASWQVDFAIAKLELELDRSCYAQALAAEIPPKTPASAHVIDMAAFVRIATALRDGARRGFQSNGGFSEEELDELRQQFVKYDNDGSGDITNKELVGLIEDAFPEMANDPKMRPFLTQMLHEIDADESGSLDFQDFVRLMQQLRDLQDRARIAKEQRAIHETNFSAQEVKEFREIFLASDEDDAAVLTLKQVCHMMESICPLGDQNKKRLTEIFRSITERPKSDKANQPQARDVADFPEFLWFMRKLLDVNFAGLAEKDSGK